MKVFSQKMPRDGVSMGVCSSISPKRMWEVKVRWADSVLQMCYKHHIFVSGFT